MIEQFDNAGSPSRSIVCLVTACVLSLAGPGWAAEASQERPHASSPTTISREDQQTDAERSAKEPPLALPRPTRRTSDGAPSWNKKLPRPTGQMFILLGIAGGLALVWRLTRGSERNLPSDLVEVYGRVPLNPKQHLHLVRVGNTLLVLIESAQGLQRLAEITDPEEVRNITQRFRTDGTGVVPPELSNVVSAGRHLASFRSA